MSRDSAEDRLPQMYYRPYALNTIRSVGMTSKQSCRVRNRRQMAQIRSRFQQINDSLGEECGPNRKVNRATYMNVRHHQNFSVWILQMLPPTLNHDGI